MIHQNCCYMTVAQPLVQGDEGVLEGPLLLVVEGVVARHNSSKLPMAVIHMMVLMVMTPLL
jgi:hypothetical protein